MMQIWIIKFRIAALKRKRERAIIDISTNHSKIANKIDRLEDLNPILFRELDTKIAANQRLLDILKSK